MLRGLTAEHIAFVVVGGVAASVHGSAVVTNDLDICYDARPENVARLAALLATWDAYPRGIARDLPFFMDTRTIRTTPLLTLTTREGDIDLLDDVPGVGRYDRVAARADRAEAFDITFAVLDLPGLILAKRAARRPKDVAQLPELEALLALRAVDAPE